MNKDINIDELRSNCYRQSKIPGEFMLQLRVPGAVVTTECVDIVKEIAEKYGDKHFHIGPRQTLNVPRIKYENIDKVNKLVDKYIRLIEFEDCGIEELEKNEGGYPAIGVRNVTACMGGDSCVKANVKTAGLAKKLEKILYPSEYHIKVNITGCPNDCIKASLSDFGIFGVTLPQYDYERCVVCGGCVRACEKQSTGALREVNGRIEISRDVCIGCGACTDVCPTRAFKRHEKSLYRVAIGGRTSKKDPRLGKIFLDYVDEETLLAVFGNWETFSRAVLGDTPLYLHGGHLMDRAGYKMFKEIMLKGVTLNKEAKVAKTLNWNPQEYKANINLKHV
ncbi:MAG: sulfite reductase subunit C [Clostridium perfringens]|nr:sulfite reductase subunit C [Clostridium perfringens]